MKNVYLKAFLVFVIFISNAKLKSQWVQTNGPYNSNFCLVASDSNIYSCSGASAYYTINNGKIWKEIYNNDTSLFHKNIESIAVKDSNIFIGIWRYGIFHSTNNGKNWNNSGLINNGIILLTFRDSILYAGSLDSGLFVSYNFGKTWTNIGFIDKIVPAIAFNDSNLIVSVYGNGVFIKSFKDTVWKEINNGLEDKYVKCLAINDTNFFAGTQHGVFISSNNGKQWLRSISKLNSTYINSFNIYQSNILAGTNSGVFHSKDYGNNWIDFNNGLTNKIVYSITTNDSFIFAGTYGGPVWRRPLTDIVTYAEDEPQQPLKEKIITQNFPNPFQYSTNIEYTLPKTGNITIKIYDTQGQLLRDLYSGTIDAGKHTATWDGRTNTESEALNGVYMYRIQYEGETITGKMVLIK